MIGAHVVALGDCSVSAAAAVTPTIAAVAVEGRAATISVAGGRSAAVPLHAPEDGEDKDRAKHDEKPAFNLPSVHFSASPPAPRDFSVRSLNKVFNHD